MHDTGALAAQGQRRASTRAGRNSLCNTTAATNQGGLKEAPRLPRLSFRESAWPRQHTPLVATRKARGPTTHGKGQTAASNITSIAENPSVLSSPACSSDANAVHLGSGRTITTPLRVNRAPLELVADAPTVVRHPRVHPQHGQKNKHTYTHISQVVAWYARQTHSADQTDWPRKLPPRPARCSFVQATLYST